MRCIAYALLLLTRQPSHTISKLLRQCMSHLCSDKLILKHGWPKARSQSNLTSTFTTPMPEQVHKLFRTCQERERCDTLIGPKTGHSLWAPPGKKWLQCVQRFSFPNAGLAPVFALCPFQAHLATQLLSNSPGIAALLKFPAFAPEASIPVQLHLSVPCTSSNFFIKLRCQRLGVCTFLGTDVEVRVPQSRPYGFKVLQGLVVKGSFPAHFDMSTGRPELPPVMQSRVKLVQTSTRRKKILAKPPGCRHPDGN